MAVSNLLIHSRAENFLRRRHIPGNANKTTLSNAAIFAISIRARVRVRTREREGDRSSLYNSTLIFVRLSTPRFSRHASHHFRILFTVFFFFTREWKNHSGAEAGGRLLSRGIISLGIP